MTPEYIAKEKTRLQALEQQYADMIRQFKESQAWKNVTSPVEKKDTRVVTIKPPRTSHIITEEKMTFSCGSDSEKDHQVVILPRRQRSLIDLSPSTKPDLTLPWNGVAACKSRSTLRDRPDVVGKELSPIASALTTNTGNHVTHSKNNSVDPGMMPGVATKPVVTAASVAGTKAKVAGTKANVEAGTKANVEAGTKANIEAGIKTNVEADTKANVDAGTKSKPKSVCKFSMPRGQQLETLKRLHVSLSFIPLIYSETYVKSKHGRYIGLFCIYAKLITSFSTHPCYKLMLEPDVLLKTCFAMIIKK